MLLYNFLLVIMILDGFVLGIVILLQSGKGGGLAAVGGGAAATDGILAGRQATTLLTRTTWTTGSIFLALALVLSIMSSRAGPSESITRTQLQQTGAVPTPLPLGGAGGDATLPGGLGAGGAAVPPTGAGAGTPPDTGGVNPDGSGD